MHVCCSTKSKLKNNKILSESPINTRLTYQEKVHYSALFETHAENINGKRVVKSNNFPQLLGLFGTDIAQKFAERIFKYIANNSEYIDKSQYFTYLDLYHHGDVSERCRITFKLMTDSTKGDRVYKQNFIDYLNLIVNAIKKVHPSATDNLLTEKEMEILFKKISSNREYFTQEDFENMYNKKPELLTWIDYFKNNDEDILFSMDNNIKKLLQQTQNFFSNFSKNLMKNKIVDIFKGDKVFGQTINEIDNFTKKLSREIKKINTKHSLDLKRILENPNAKDMHDERLKNASLSFHHHNQLAAASINNLKAKSSNNLNDHSNLVGGSRNDNFSNHMVNSTRLKTENEKLNPISSSNFIMELPNLIETNNLGNDVDRKENESFTQLDESKPIELNNIIEKFNYVKVVLYENQPDEIPEEDEYDYDNESIHTPNKSISAIRNPNIKLNDSDYKILSDNNPKVEKVDFNATTFRKEKKKSESINHHYDNVIDLEKTKKIKNSEISEDKLVFSTKNHYAAHEANNNKNNNFSRDEKLMQEDIIISEINDNLKTPNINIINQNNHFLSKDSSNKCENTSSENLENGNEITSKRVTFKFNSHNNERRNINDFNLIKFSSKNDNTTISNNAYMNTNSLSNNNSNENLQNLLIHNENGASNNNNLKKKTKSQPFEKEILCEEDINLKLTKKGNKSFDNLDGVIQNGNFSSEAKRKTYESNFDFKKRINSNESSKYNKVFESVKDIDLGINLKRKISLRQRETIIFNQEDIIEYLQFKDFKKKLILFIEKIRDLIINFTAGLTTIDQSYSWIQKRFLKDNLKRIRKSYKEKSKNQVNDYRVSINKHNNKPKIDRSTNLKATDKNFSLLIHMIMGITLSVQQNPYIEIKLGDKLDNYFKSNIYSIQTSGFHSYISETYYIKDYAGIIFEKIRRMFGIDKEDYINSISPGNMISEMMISSSTIIEELCSTGKSGSVFYYTKDGKYIIKSIKNSEYQCLKRIFKGYFEHLLTNPYTLLPIFLGCYKLVKKIKKVKTKIYFIVMQNIFSTDKEIHLRYDLKGSEIGRRVMGNKNFNNFGKEAFALKDLDLEVEKRMFYTGEKRNLIIRQLESDTQFLRKNNIIDYSLLVGIHMPDIKRSISQNPEIKREENKKVFEYQENIQNLKLRKSALSKTESAKFKDKYNNNLNHEDSINNKECESEISHYKRDVNFSDSNSNNDQFINSIEANNKHAYKEMDGGVKSVINSEIFYFGIIDILTEYNCLKRFEYVSKMMFYFSKKMSCVPPIYYQTRFFNYMKQKFGDSKDEIN